MYANRLLTLSSLVLRKLCCIHCRVKVQLVYMSQLFESNCFKKQNFHICFIDILNYQAILLAESCVTERKIPVCAGLSFFLMCLRMPLHSSTEQAFLRSLGYCIQGLPLYKIKTVINDIKLNIKHKKNLH